MVWFGNRIVDTTTIVDDFESYTDTADFRSQWETNDAPMDWGIGTSGAGLAEGSQYLECTDPGGGADNAFTAEADGVLNYYPQRGDFIEFFLTPTGTLADKNSTFFIFGADVGTGFTLGHDEGYFVELDADADDINIGTTAAGNPTTQSTFAISGGVTLDQTYRIEVDFDTADDGTIAVEAFEEGSETSLGSTSFNDTSYNHRGICVRGDYDGATQAAGHFDYIVVTSGGGGGSGGNGGGSTVVISDSFEDGNITEYELGDSANYSVLNNSSIAIDGDYYLEQTDTGYSEITTETNDADYPEAGDAFTFWIYMGTDGGSNTYGGIYFGYDSSTNYWIQVNAGDSEFVLDYDSGSDTATSVSIPSDAWYYVETEWDDGSTFGGANGDITCTLYDDTDTQLAQVSGNDTQKTDGGIGWWGADAPRFDYLHITNR